MSQSKNPVEPRRRVWRITQAAPLGEFVDVTPATSSGAPGNAPPAEEARGKSDVRESGWRASSHDLLSGIEISEEPDTIPGDLLDALFKRQ